MSEQGTSNTPEEHVWDVESSAPPEPEEITSEEGHDSTQGTTSNRPGYLSLAFLLLSFTLPAFLEPWSLLIPVAIGIYGLFWAWSKRKTSSNAGLVATVIITVLLMLGAGIIAMRMIPDEAWGDVLSMLFYAGWIILIPALTGIAFILAKQRGKRKPQ